MARIQDIDIPYLEFAEAAAPGTPAAGIVRQYAKTDGLLYSKDDAGTETLVSGGAGGGGIDSGTSNPVSPSDGDLFYRTDLDLLIRYRSTGTRWVCTCLHTAQLATQEASTLPLSANGAFFYASMIGVDRDVWLEKWYVTTNVITTNNGTNFWTVVLEDSAGTDIATFNTSGDTAGTKANHEASIGALLGTTSPDDLWIQESHTKTLSPGTLYIVSQVTYRMVVT